MRTPPDESLPPYTYVPGGPWPHPSRSPEGHLFGRKHGPAEPIDEGPGGWASSSLYLRGIALFNAGYYWEAHEAWESLWHAHGRKGTTAEVLKALIKLAAAGVKIREGRTEGVRTHARRAADLFARARDDQGVRHLGLDLEVWNETASAIADDPPRSPFNRDAKAVCVFPFQIEPS